MSNNKVMAHSKEQQGHDSLTPRSSNKVKAHSKEQQEPWRSSQSSSKPLEHSLNQISNFLLSRHTLNDFFLLILLFWVAMLLTTSNHFWIYEFDWQSFGHPWASISSLYFVKPWCYKLDLVLDCWPKQSRISNILISLYYGIRQTWK